MSYRHMTICLYDIQICLYPHMGVQLSPCRGQVYPHMGVYIHIYIYVYPYIYIDICICLYTYTYIYMQTYVNMSYTLEIEYNCGGTNNNTYYYSFFLINILHFCQFTLFSLNFSYFHSTPHPATERYFIIFRGHNNNTDTYIHISISFTDETPGWVFRPPSGGHQAPRR